MDPEQTFIRVQERFAQMLTPRIRATLEYLYLFMAVTLFCILVVMHANYVQQVYQIITIFLKFLIIVSFREKIGLPMFMPDLLPPIHIQLLTLSETIYG